MRAQQELAITHKSADRRIEAVMSYGEESLPKWQEIAEQMENVVTEHSSVLQQIEPRLEKITKSSQTVVGSVTDLEAELDALQRQDVPDLVTPAALEARKQTQHGSGPDGLDLNDESLVRSAVQQEIQQQQKILRNLASDYQARMDEAASHTPAAADAPQDCLTVDGQHTLITESMSTYAADKTGRPDLAIGSSVVRDKALTSSEYIPPRRGLNRVNIGVSAGKLDAVFEPATR